MYSIGAFYLHSGFRMIIIYNSGKVVIKVYDSVSTTRVIIPGSYARKSFINLNSLHEYIKTVFTLIAHTQFADIFYVRT